MICRNCRWIWPLRPQSLPEGEVASEQAESWDNIGDANVLRDPEAQVIGAAEDNEEASAIHRSSTRVPVGKPEPPQPIRAEKASRDLTHTSSIEAGAHIALRDADQLRSIDPTPMPPAAYAEFARTMLLSTMP